MAQIKRGSISFRRSDRKEVLNLSFNLVSYIFIIQGGSFAQGAKLGAPQAIQSADRWHLGKNLLDALEQVFLNRRELLKQTQQLIAQSEENTLRALPVTVGITLGSKQDCNSEKRQAHYVEMYQRIQGLHSKKVDIANIARQVGSSRRTVYRYLHMKSPPEPAVIQHIEPKAVEPYVPYLLQRWNEGCRNAEQMLRELKEMGYSPSRSSVGRFITRLRHDSGKARSFKSEKTETIYQQSVQKHRPLSPLQVARLFLSKVEKRKEWEKQYLEKLCAIDSEVAQTYEQVQEFMVMLRQLEGNGLGEWLKKVKVLGVKELQAFAKGLEKDYEAVKTGLSLKWNNGGSEGQINRLKLLKRQTYGQAGFELMRRRVLHREVKVERKQRKKKKAVTEKAA